MEGILINSKDTVSMQKTLQMIKPNEHGKFNFDNFINFILKLEALQNLTRDEILKFE